MTLNGTRFLAGQWNLSDYHVITLGDPQHSVRCVCVIANNHVWCGYRNTIHILNPKTLQIEVSVNKVLSLFIYAESFN